MQYTSEYDQRQLTLMKRNLIAFDQKQIGLNSLLGTLEFLIRALESTDDKWESEFFNELSNLDFVNALEVIKESGEKDVITVDEEVKKNLLQKSVINLKKLVDRKFIENEVSEFTKILEEILKENTNRLNLISKFQIIVWNTNEVDHVIEILNKLAYDLEYYKPDSNLSLIESLYYGDAVLTEKVNEVLKRLYEIKQSLNDEPI